MYTSYNARVHLYSDIYAGASTPPVTKYLMTKMNKNPQIQPTPVFLEVKYIKPDSNR